MKTSSSKRVSLAGKDARKAAAAPPASSPKTVLPQAGDAVEDDQYFSRAVGKAFYILNVLNQSEAPVALNEMAARTGLTKSSCFRLLHTLERLRHISQGADGRYCTVEKNRVSASTLVANALLRGPQHVARALNEEFGESVSIAVLFTNHIEVVQSYESSRVLRMSNTVGRILPPHASSLGKAITAFQPDPVCRKLLVSYGLQRYTAHTITDEAVLREEFEKIRKQGYAYEGEESTWDGCCFGAPIFDGDPGGNGPAVAAISISMPKSRVPFEEAQPHMVELLLLSARTLSQSLGAALLERA